MGIIKLPGQDRISGRGDDGRNTGGFAAMLCVWCVVCCVCVVCVECVVCSVCVLAKINVHPPKGASGHGTTTSANRSDLDPPGSRISR